MSDNRREKTERRPRRRRQPTGNKENRLKNAQAPPPQPESVAKVFSLPELLESILLHLPRKHLLTSAQRVSKSWHCTIASSPSLQHYLFFLADSKAEFTPNPLLRDTFPCFYPNPNRMFPAWETEAGIVPKDAGFVSAGEHNAGSLRDPDEIFPMLDTRFNGERNLAFIRTGASWRRMLVSQPPPVRVVRVDRFHVKGFEWKLVEFKEGLRMGVLFDEVFEMNWALSRRCLAKGCKFNCYGEPAFITWRVPGEVVKERPVEETLRWPRESWQEDARLPGVERVESPPEWLRGCDLVLGEDQWHRMGSPRCRHPWPDGMGARCFMWQRGLNPNPHLRWTRRKGYTSVCGKSMKWLFQCKEYKPGGPLSLPPVKRKK